MEISINGKPREVAEGTNVAQLVAQLELDSRHVAVEVNLELIPRGRHAQYRLHAGDQLEVVTLVGGG